ncbi:MAG: MiaB/RimO family radical SAM methylthiotransferase [Christensenellaceae bacterium]|jgi:threonylcarbamoyladenosine tRNA methylthiotransferase MtaB|nr:MiaB/RimO family radical SAM methylthiotransferase [Christensenellaceae bacterium]
MDETLRKPHAVVFNIGCKSNQYDCDLLTSELIKRGYSVSDKLETADIYITNTCAVTSTAESKSRQIITRIRKLNPSAQIYVFGCASVKNKDFYEQRNLTFVGGIDYVEILKALDSNKSKQTNSILVPSSLRTRTYVKIQDGCDNFCSYCIISRLRGKPRSKPISQATDEIIKVSQKSSEIVITGINLSLYGIDTCESLAGLIENISEVNSRIRLSSFYPNGVNKELLDALFSLKNFSPHFHLSLQHGDSKILKDMNRGYTADDYQRKVNLIREYDKNAAITTDIIVGYPTEDDNAFAKSYDFANSIGFSDIHIFPFSPRPGTPACLLQKLPGDILELRVKKMTALKNDLKTNYLLANLNIPQNVIFEKQGEISEGYSQYYIRIYADTVQKNGMVMPCELYKNGLIGDII